MGKGTIISGGTDGQYTVRIEYNLDRVQADISRLTSRIAGYTSYIAGLSDGRAKELALTEKAGLERYQAYLQAIESRDQGHEQEIWCADLTEDLSGEVGTIEIPGEPETVLIQPGYGGHAAYDSARDGQLEKPEHSTPAGTYWNMALQPLWQKHKPTFRTGTITALAGGLADVAVDAAVSSQQGIDVNLHTTLSSVPIDYMTCDEDAFEVGDDVLVEFVNQSWDDPVIIGFAHDPKPCTVFLVIRCGGAAEAERRYVVWDTQGKDFADVTGVSWPAEWSDIEAFLSTKDVQADTAGVWSTGATPGDEWPSSTYMAYSYEQIWVTERWPPYDQEPIEMCRLVDISGCTPGVHHAETPGCTQQYNRTWQALPVTVHLGSTHQMSKDVTIASCSSYRCDHFYSDHEEWVSQFDEANNETFGTAVLNPANDAAVNGYLRTTKQHKGYCAANWSKNRYVIGYEGFESDCCEASSEPDARFWVNGSLMGDPTLEEMLQALWDVTDPDADGAYSDYTLEISYEYELFTHMGSMGTLTLSKSTGSGYFAPSQAVADVTSAVIRDEGSDQRIIENKCCPKAVAQLFVYQCLTETKSGGSWGTDNRHVFVQAQADYVGDGTGKSTDATAFSADANLKAAVEDLISAYCTAKGTAANALASLSFDLSFYS